MENLLAIDTLRCEEMDFDVNDQDLCKDCSYVSFNDAPYGDEK